MTEVEILKQLDHPNIVKLFEVYEDDKHWSLVMELVQGGQLFEQIYLRAETTELEARRAIKQIIDAVLYLHQHGILHRDIRPENLLLMSKEMGLDSLKLVNFGLAKQFEGGQQLASTVCGSSFYVAPEIIRQEKYGKECDYWSIGVVTYILLSGMPPFYSEDNIAMFDYIKECKYNFEGR